METNIKLPKKLTFRKNRSFRNNLYFWIIYHKISPYHMEQRKEGIYSFDLFCIRWMKWSDTASNGWRIQRDRNENLYSQISIYVQLSACFNCRSLRLHKRRGCCKSRWIIYWSSSSVFIPQKQKTDSEESAIDGIINYDQ